MSSIAPGVCETEMPALWEAAVAQGDSTRGCEPVPEDVASTDPLSGTLERLYFPDWSAGETTLVAPWGFAVPAGIAGFYAIRAGGCWLALDDCSAPLRLESGDIAVLVHGSPHRLCDPSASPAVSFGELYARTNPTAAPRTDSAPTTTLVHGHFILDSWGCDPFRFALPKVLRCTTSASSRATANMEPLLNVIADEKRSLRPGWQAIVDRLVHVLFLQALRACLTDRALPPCGARKGMASWLVAAADSSIGRVLERMHAELERPWTVSALAREVHMSKSAFSERFCQVVGQPPSRYLTECRMRRACQLLRESTLGVKRIAALVGYESASSFSNAFKRLTGKAPAAFRKNEHSLPQGEP